MNLSLQFLPLIILLSGCFAAIDDPSAIQNEDSTVSITQSGNIATASIGATSDVILEVVNNGSDLNSWALELENDFAEQVSTTCPSIILADATCQVTVRVFHSRISQSTIIKITSGATTLTSITVSFSSAAIVPTVNSLYPLNGENWNDYVKRADITKSGLEQTDTACDESASLEPCIHGGELKTFSLGDMKSCDGITIEDDLGAFNWRCIIVSGKANIFSIGLKEEKNLSDLVNAASWKDNFVSVKHQGIALATSLPTTWWSNTITSLPDNSGSSSPTTLTSSSTIYTLSSSRTTSGYILSGSKNAMVMLNGARLTYNGASGNNCDDRNAGPGTDGICMIMGISNDFLWMEGYYDGNASAGSDTSIAVIHLFRAGHLRLRNLSVTGESGTNLGASEGGLLISDGHNIKLENIRSFNNATNGYARYYNNENFTIRNSKFYNNRGIGIYTEQTNSASDDNLIINSITAFNGSAGVVAFGTGNATTHSDTNVLNVTSTFNGNIGVATNRVGGFLKGILSVGNSSSVADIDANPVDGAFYNLAFGYLSLSDGDSGSSIALNGVNIVTDDVHSKGSNCNASQDNFNADCALKGISSGTSVTSVDFTTDIRGRQSVDDSTNTTDTNGTASYTASLDWINFDNPYRVWGKSNSSSYSDAGNVGACTSGTCAIWDLALVSTGTKIRNTSSNGTAQNAIYASNQTCPSAIHGDVSGTNVNGQIFLVNAHEIMNDSFGDEDGLCESGEECLYNPNFGAYQGHGDYYAAGTCVFVDGTISGVKMYAYPNNGY